MSDDNKTPDDARGKSDQNSHPEEAAGGVNHPAADDDTRNAAAHRDEPSPVDDPWTQSTAETAQSATGQGADPVASQGSASRPVKGARKSFMPGRQPQAVDLSGDDWERDVLNRLAFATLNEQRRARRWSVFFKALAFIYVGALVLLFYNSSGLGEKGIAGGKHTAIIEINGTIADDTEASADNIVTGLRAAFKNSNTAAVILRINSPGGSPVQAGYVNDEIKRLRAKYPDIKLYAVITDMCASGGYYIAVAADEIYADKASIVGSIGVLMNGFGFVEAMKKVGVERRLITAGKHKGILDPFSPIKKEELQHVHSLLDSVHQQFIHVVKEGRGDRLSNSPELFSGLFWNGEKGLELGLVDGLGSSSYVAREVVGVEKMVDFTVHASVLDRFAERIGVGFAKVLSSTLGVNSDMMH